MEKPYRKSLKGTLSMAIVFVLLIATELVHFSLTFAGNLELRRLLLSVFEAGLVGAIADWFAITCLFRYPFGIPIPHARLLPNKKDQIAAGLASVIRNFLPDEVLRQRIAEINFSQLAVATLENPDFRIEIKQKVGGFVAGQMGNLQNLDTVNRGLDELALRLKQRDLALDLAKLAKSAIENGAAEALVPEIAGFASQLVTLNRKSLAVEIEDRIKKQLWGPFKLFANRKGDDVVAELLAELTKARQPGSESVKLIKSQILSLAQKLQTNPSENTTVNQNLYRVLDDKLVREKWLAIAGQALGGLGNFLQREGDEVSNLDKLIDAVLNAIVRDLCGDNASAALFNKEVSGMISDIVVRNDLIGHASEMVKQEIIKLSTASFTEFLERSLYNDLQYIRLNGAVVGGLVGGVLYVGRVLFGWD